MRARRSRRSRNSWLKVILVILVAVLAIAAIATVLVQIWEPAYVIYKRLSASSPHVYDEIKPEYAAIDPAQFISVQTPGDVEIVRDKLRTVIRDGRTGSADFVDLSAVLEIQTDELPTHNITALRSLVPVEAMRAFRFDFGAGILSYAVYLRPPKATGDIVVLQYGFAGEFQDGRVYVERLLAQGLSVIGLNQLAYGGNSIYHRLGAKIGGTPTNLHHEVEEIPGGIFPHVAQITWAISLAQHINEGGPVHLVGFSMGAYMVTLAAAIDSRPTVVSANSGIYPAYLRDRKQDAPVGVATHRGLLEIATHFDLMLLAGLGEGRHYMQAFNRYDRCCYSNTKARLYEPTLQSGIKALGLPGGFHVVIDESHGRHILSPLAAEALIETIQASRH